MSFSPTVSTLLDMFTYRRPAKSKTEKEFINKFLLNLPNAYADKQNNIIVRVGGEPGTPDFFPVLWSSHTDTVHREGGRQKIYYTGEEEDSFLFLGTNDKGKLDSNCLGADCTAGVWLMREMILANVPGLYIFHSEEEVGGYGSLYISNHTPELLNGIQYAIAFDRKGYGSVITDQITNTASTAFATALCNLLKENWDVEWEPDDGGIFTDTANYADTIPECTNISVGYSGAHTCNEMQDVNFLLELRAQMIAIAHRIPLECPAVRDPTIYPVYNWAENYRNTWTNPYSSYKQLDTVEEEDNLFNLIVREPDAVLAMMKDYGLRDVDLTPYIKKANHHGHHNR